MSVIHFIEIAHEDPIFAAGIQCVLSEQSGMLLAARGDRAASSASGLAPDLLIADFTSGMAWLQRAKGVGPSDANTRVLIVSPHCGGRDVQCALIAGAVGYVDHACGVSELRAAVTAALRGETYLSPSVAQRLASSLSYATLTARETDVLTLIASGLCNKRIASMLEIATGTVKTHVSAILEKLRARSRTEAVILARDRGLLSQPFEGRLFSAQAQMHHAVSRRLRRSYVA